MSSLNICHSPLDIRQEENSFYCRTSRGRCRHPQICSRAHWTCSSSKPSPATHSMVGPSRNEFSRSRAMCFRSARALSTLLCTASSTKAGSARSGELQRTTKQPGLSLPCSAPPRVQKQEPHTKKNNRKQTQNTQQNPHHHQTQATR